MRTGSDSDDDFVCLFCTIATVLQLYHGSDMIYEMRKRKSEPTILQTQGIFNLPHHDDDEVFVSLYSSFMHSSAMAGPLLLTSGPTTCEATLHGCGTSPVCLFYAMAIAFQLYHGSDIMYYYKMRRKPEPTLLQTQGIF